MQTCSQENPRVKTNWGMGSKALKKKKNCTKIKRDEKYSFKPKLEKY